MRPRGAQEAQGPQHQEGPLINLERELDCRVVRAAVPRTKVSRESTAFLCVVLRR
jgi:hypothetical protein